MCLQGISRASDPSAKASVHTAHRESASTWPAEIRTAGSDATALLLAGGFSGWAQRLNPICERRSSIRSNPDPSRVSDMAGGSGRPLGGSAGGRAEGDYGIEGRIVPTAVAAAAAGRRRMQGEIRRVHGLYESAVAVGADDSAIGSEGNGYGALVAPIRRHRSHWSCCR
ncbi:calcium-dependent phosphotriesterase superfamily protein [Striga asiatica]|uniref:Calcium-dependent phosphotriesterase superfamily protein n=1 Tax=Striga asiatica TaxID=4170 RepID=A0A5A7PQS8_STRAF|nr:calcium-dependent phosphotriesterase superfamily protein [Striga asiatica]